MYGKFFASAFNGSMMGAGPDVFALWAYMLANAHDGVAEVNQKLVAVLIGMTDERVAAALDFLASPDQHSRNPDEEGRRIIKIGTFAWRIVSWEEYRAISNSERKREYDRKKQSEHREKKRGRESPPPVPPNLQKPEPEPAESSSLTQCQEVSLTPKPTAFVTCPPNLALTEAQVTTMAVTPGIPSWAIQALTVDLVTKWLGKDDTKTLASWRGYLLASIKRIWSDPSQRPQKPVDPNEAAAKLAAHNAMIERSNQAHIRNMQELTRKAEEREATAKAEADAELAERRAKADAAKQALATWAASDGAEPTENASQVPPRPGVEASGL